MAEKLSPWEKVVLARKLERPTSIEYIIRIFDSFFELHGDRYFGDDSAIVGGLARFNNYNLTVIGQQKGRDLKENEKRNYGMPSPEGYRKSLRLMKQAEKFRRPIVLFIDTPGAYCGIDAEERGQGEAIAKNLYEMSSLKVPILSIVIGEGGSGGALAFGVGNEVWMLENAIYSVISPEGFSSIMWKDSKKAPEASELMKLTAEDLLDLNIIEEIIEEPEELNKDNMDDIVETLKLNIEEFLEKYTNMSEEELVNQRYERFRKL